MIDKLESVKQILTVISISFTGEYTTEQKLAKEALAELNEVINIIRGKDNE